MKVRVEFLGLPMISERVGGTQVELDVSGRTVKDVVAELIRRYGRKVRDAFYDGEGHFDLMIQIALNGTVFISPDRQDTPLKEGDHVLFMLLLAGG